MSWKIVFIQTRMKPEIKQNCLKSWLGTRRRLSAFPGTLYSHVTTGFSIGNFLYCRESWNSDLRQPYHLLFTSQCYSNQLTNAGYWCAKHHGDPTQVSFIHLVMTQRETQETSEFSLVNSKEIWPSWHCNSLLKSPIFLTWDANVFNTNWCNLCHRLLYSS